MDRRSRWYQLVAAVGRGLGAALALAALAGAVAPQTAHAGVYTYSGTSRQINVGILALDSVGQYTGTDIIAPYSFYILDQRADIKPQTWKLVNPLAPTTITSDINSAWGNPYSIGQQVTPNMGPYWFIDLKSAAESFSSGVDELRQFNLLVIHTHAAIGLSRAEREMLRQYVDQGGTLWVEDSGNATTLTQDPNNGSPTPGGLFLDAMFNDSGSTQGFAFLPDTNHRHPLITTPYFLSDEEVNTLGDKDVSKYFMTSMASATIAPDIASLISVVGNSAHADSSGVPLPYIAAGDYGAGHLIVDNADSMDDISNPVAGGHPPFCPNNMQSARVEDLKFVVNMISWGANTAATDQANARHTGYQDSPMRGALIKDWQFPDPNGNPLSSGASPTPAKLNVIQSAGVAISGNIAYVSTMETDRGASGTVGRLRAFDLIPTEDLNQDGNVDDGDVIVSKTTGAITSYPIDPTTNVAYGLDWSRGKPYDELWMAELTPPAGGGGASSPLISPPTVAALPGGAVSSQTGYSGAVLVEGDNGQVSIFDATSNPGAATVSPVTTLPSAALGPNTFSAQTANNTSVPAPAYYRGWLVAAQPQDKTSGDPSVYFYNFAHGTQANVTLPSDGTSIVCAPVVASIPSNDPVYGGDDIVCYVATQKALYALILGSRDEKLSGASNPYKTKVQDITGLTINGVYGAPEDQFVEGTRTAFVYLMDSPAWPVGPLFRGAAPDAAGGIDVYPLGSDTSTTYFADYDVNIGTSGGVGSANIIRHTIFSQIQDGYGQVGAPAAIQGFAIGPDNVLYVTVNESSSGYIEAIQEQNPLNIYGSNTVTKWRFALANVPAANNGDNIAYDGQSGYAGFGNFQFVGPPVVDGQNVYALAYYPKATGVGLSGVTRVMCFNPNPTIQVLLNQSVDTQYQITMTQADETGTASKLQINPGQYQLSDAGKGLITIKNFESVGNGSGPNAQSEYINLGVPMQVNASFQAIDTNNGAETGSQVTGQAFNISTNSGGTPLLQWWMDEQFGTPPSGAVNGASIVPGPMRKLGDYLYFGSGVQNSASVTSPVPGEAQINWVKATQKALGFIPTKTSTGTLIPDTTNSFYLPSGYLNTGLTASGSYAIAAGSTVQYSVAGANVPYGGIACGIYAKTMIADNNRIVELDTNDEATWSLDSTIQQSYRGDVSYSADSAATNNPDYPGATLATTNVSLSRPSSLSQLSANDILIADTGNARCVRFDRTGHVLWELTNFQDPNGLLQPGQPLSLNHPTGVFMWTQHTGSGSTVQWVNHYLICDSGNFRVLEVTDTYKNNNGVITVAPADSHVLAFTSHTYDKLGRKYRYVSAHLFTDAAGNVSVIASIANTMVAPLKVDGNGNYNLDVAARDTTGSSVVTLRYNVSATAKTDSFNGLPSAVVNQVKYIDSNNATQIKPFRNLRFMTEYQPQGAIPPVTSGGTTTPGTPDNVMIADDDGVFDGEIGTLSNGQLGLDTTATLNGVPIGFVFTAADYKTLLVTNATQYVTSGSLPYAADLFAPSSAQHLVNGDYLITNGAARGDSWAYDTTASDNDQHSGGCVFEVTNLKKLDSPIWGRFIDNTGPLSQPSFSVLPL